MNTMHVEITTFRPHKASHWNRLKGYLGEGQHGARSRTELTSLSDRLLRDIGISRCTANFEASKPFWMA